MTCLRHSIFALRIDYTRTDEIPHYKESDTQRRHAHRQYVPT